MHCELAGEVVESPKCEALRWTVTDDRKNPLEVDEVLPYTRYVETGFLPLLCEEVRMTLLGSNLAIFRAVFLRLNLQRSAFR